jgi:ABC-type nitrate/sulfonate/bicarbonate transport system permease component
MAKSPESRYTVPVRRTLVPLLLLVIWFTAGHYRVIDRLFLPSAADIWEAFRALAPLLPAAILTTLSMVIAGFVIGVSFGAASGLLMAYSPWVRDLLGSVFDFLRPVPVFALIPMFILWFGIGRAPQITLIALGTSVVLGVTTLEAIRNVPSIYMRAALTLGADRRQIYTTVIVPYILPHLIGAVRVAAAASWGLDVAAEFMGSQQGLGYLIILQQTFLRTAGILLLVIVYSVLAVIFDTLLRMLEARLTRWTERHTVRGAVGAIVGLG